MTAASPAFPIAKNIVVAWVITMPMAAVVAAIFYTPSLSDEISRVKKRMTGSDERHPNACRALAYAGWFVKPPGRGA